MLVVSSHIVEGWGGCYGAVVAEVARDVVRGDELLHELKVLLQELGQPGLLFLSGTTREVVRGERGSQEALMAVQWRNDLAVELELGLGEGRERRPAVTAIAAGRPYARWVSKWSAALRSDLGSP